MSSKITLIPGTQLTQISPLDNMPMVTQINSPIEVTLSEEQVVSEFADYVIIKK